MSDSGDGETLRNAFVTAMSRLAAGVVVVTSHVGERSWGMTVSACCSLTVAPPTMLVSLGRNTASARAITEGGYFGVSVLGDHLLEVAHFGSAPGTPKFIEEFCASEQIGEDMRSPVVDGALAHVDCTVLREVDVEDHVVFVGAVCDVHVDDTCPAPLVYFDRRYHTVASSGVHDANPVEGFDIRWWEDVPIVIPSEVA